MILEAKNISFRYGKDTRQILNDFSLQIESRERVGIVAKSGFGKTTFCKILAGYESRIRGGSAGRKTSVCLGRILSGADDLAASGAGGESPPADAGSAEEGDEVEESVIRGLGIEKDWQNRFPAEISGGEMQRFCIARALGKRTRFLLADEISTMLDLITQSQIWSFLVEEVEKREIGLLAVSHSMPLLEQVCTRICYLEEKKD